jgi:hypothetical protein
MDPTMTVLIAVLAPLLFVVIWILVTGILSYIGGWHALADRYAAPEDVDVTAEQRFRFRSILLRRIPLVPARYRGCVTISLTSAGCHLAVLFVFRFRHPPLLIPWTAIVRCEEGSLLGFGWTDVEVRDADPVIRIFGGPGQAVAEEWRRRSRPV